MRLTYGAASNVGLVRTQNEDSFVAGDGIYAVCDGMGGALAGEVASEAACRILMELGRQGSPADELREAVRRANAEILRRSIEEPGMAGMGTTLTAAVRQGDAVVLAHVGDSRAYLLHAGQLRQLTEDHSLVAELVRQGRLTLQQAAAHPHRSVITRALGTEHDVQPDVSTVPLEPGDRLLLCSDGVSGLVPDDRLEELLGSPGTPQEVADALVHEALAHGGDDNATAVVVFAEEGHVAPGDVEVIRFGPERRSPNSPPPPRGPAPGHGSIADGVPGWWRRGFRSRRLWKAVAIVILALVVGLAGLAVFNSSVYHVGTVDDQVVLYRGLPATVFGVRMCWVVEESKVSYSRLEPYLRQRVDAHELTTKEEGQRFLRSLDSQS